MLLVGVLLILAAAAAPQLVGAAGGIVLRDAPDADSSVAAEGADSSTPGDGSVAADGGDSSVAADAADSSTRADGGDSSVAADGADTSVAAEGGDSSVADDSTVLVKRAPSYPALCDVRLKQRNGPKQRYACCRARKASSEDQEDAEELLPYVSIGVCADNIIGFLDKHQRPVSPDEASSDPDATDDQPGIDEGSCHVYQIYNRERDTAGKHVRNGCLPGNMVTTAQKLSKLLVDIGNGEGTCHLHNIHSSCDAAEALDPGTPYSYDILINSQALNNRPRVRERFTADVEGLGCAVLPRPENDGKLFVRCKL